MKKKIHMSLDDIVFEHRNKAYGAYALRQEYRANLTKSAVIGSLLMMTVFLSSFVAYRLNPAPKIEKPTGPIIILSDPPVIIPDVPEPPNEPVVEKPKQEVIKQVEFPPQITPVDNEEPEDEHGVPSEEDLRDAAIGNETIDGPPVEGSFVNPGPIEIPGDIIAPEPPAPPAPKMDEPVLISEVMPEFEGGMSKMYKWLGRNLKYPDNASRNGIEGRVVVSFIVEKDGGISDVKILKGIGFGCDEEAERVVKAMPKWKAGIQNGRPVRVKYTLPLTFKIN